MPRPSRWPVKVQTFVPSAMADAVKAQAKREGVPVSDIVRRAITAEVTRLNNTVK